MHNKLQVLVLVWILGTPLLFAANHAVRPACSFNGNGNSWACAAGAGQTGAYNAIPSTLTRGDVYYLADGSYSAYTFNTTANGTLVSELRKAQDWDYGELAGWQAATSGFGVSQARFSRASGFSLTLQASYLIVNGNGQQTTTGCGGAGAGTDWTADPPNKKDCGIRFDADACSPGSLNSGADNCGRAVRTSGGVTNVTFRYIQDKGTGLTDGSLTSVDHTSVDNYWTWFHYFGHNASCMYDTWKASNDTTSYSYYWWLGPNRNSCHSEYMETNQGRGPITAHHNVFRDIDGTSIWAWTCWGGGSCGTTNGVYIYDNLIYYTSGFVPSGTGMSSGLIGCFNGNICDNVVFAQNTIVNCSGNNCGFYGGAVSDGGGYMNIRITNNLWYGTRAADRSTPVCPGAAASASPNVFTWDHNSYLNGGSGCNRGTGDLTTTVSSPVPFTSWTTGDFTLATDNANWNSRIDLSALGAQYGTDYVGNTFTTDRGAYQYATGVSGPSVTTTTPATGVTSTGATVGGNVTSDGGATVTARGICYSISPNPTMPCTSDGAGTGSFTSSLTGLNPSTLYHYRAFATNSAGTSYGSDQSFTTGEPGGGASVSGFVMYSGATSKN